MFRLISFKKHQTDLNLPSTKLFNEKSFYPAFANDIRSATSSILIESPYLTEPRVKQFSKLLNKKTKQGVKITILTRNPKHHTKLMEIQAYKAIKLLRASGVKVFTYNDMRHRKIAIIDNKVLYEGSLNILSQCRSREIMTRINSEEFCRRVRRFLGV